MDGLAGGFRLRVGAVTAAVLSFLAILIVAAGPAGASPVPQVRAAWGGPPKINYWTLFDRGARIDFHFILCTRRRASIRPLLHWATAYHPDPFVILRPEKAAVNPSGCHRHYWSFEDSYINGWYLGWLEVVLNGRASVSSNIKRIYVS